MGIHNNALIGASSQGYQISRSVRTRSSASAYFNRTLTTPTNNKIWTWSGWVKRGTLGAAQTLFSGQVDVNNWGIIAFLSGDTLSFQQADAGSVTSTVTTTQVFRDSSAWYHIIVVFDSTQATAANRLKMYVNGVQITVFGTATYLTQNTASRINTAIAHQISRYISAAQYFDGYMTEVNFIDGQALTPSSFGETNAVTGVWQPKKYAGTYGTNGFYLNFSDNSAVTTSSNVGIGKDFSGNGNYWTSNSISVTAGVTYDSMLDVPTPYADGGNGRGNYATWNPLFRPTTTYDANRSITNGNLDLASGTNSGAGSAGTIAYPATGKWYTEIQLTNTTIVILGIYKLSSVALPLSDGVFYVPYNGGFIWVDGSQAQTSVGNASVNDIIGIAVNCDSNQVTFYKQGVQVGSTVTYTRLTSEGGYSFQATSAGSATNATFTLNAGQRPFTYTPPTGFVALNTQNLPIPTITNGANHFAATTYTGTGASLAVSNEVNGKSFQPDFVWTKVRNNTYSNHLEDAVRGVGQRLLSDSTAAEVTGANGKLTAFNSNGFTQDGGVEVGASAGTYVAWQWNAGGSTVTNTSGSISAQVRANPTAGFSVVTFTAPASGNFSAGHGLNVTPGMVITKVRGRATSWITWHNRLNSGSPGTSYYVELNTTSAQSSFASVWGSTGVTSSVIGMGVGASCAASDTIVAYCFAAVAGYSAFGSYTGNGSADGPFVYLGFRPRFVMWKRTDSTSDWEIVDAVRPNRNVVTGVLYANLSNAEATSSGECDFTANGFKIRDNSNRLNASGGNYIFAAFAENPFKLSLAR